MRKLLAIIWKENYLRFTDRTGAIFMFITPLALSAIMGLAFSGISGPSDVPVLDIPVGIVNLDEGASQGDWGAFLIEMLVPPADDASEAENGEIASTNTDNPLYELFDAQVYDDEAEARALVESGDLTAIVVIPADFSASLMPDQSAFAALGDDPESAAAPIGQAELSIYYNGRSQIGWTIFRDVVQQFANSIATSNIAVTTTVNGLIAEIPAHPLIGLQMASGAFNDSLAEVALQASDPAANPIHITRQDVTGETQDNSFDPLSFFSPGFAIFFMGFTVTIGTASILQEQHDWTLQRMITTPTSRATILAGKMLGTYVGGILQMIVLIVAMALVGIALEGPGTVIWGEDILGVALITLTAVAAASGVGAVIAALAKNAEQAGNLGAFIQFVMGLVGGVFFPTLAMPDAMQFLPRLTFHFWGVNGYQQLAAGATVIDILPNALALLALAVLFYVIGLWQFSRRLDI